MIRITEKRFRKGVFQVHEQCSFWKPVENIINHKYKACNNQSENILFGIRTKPSNKKLSSKNLLAIEMKKTQTFMNKPIYLKIEISKIVMYKLRYNV